MANFKGVGFPLLASAVCKLKSSTRCPVAIALLAVTFSAVPFSAILFSPISFSHRAAIAQAGAETAETTVTGSVLYRARIALPPESVVEVKLLNVSLADAPAVTVAAQTIVTTGEQVPIPFSVPYAASDIDHSATYVVSADILVDDQLRWTTDTQYPVLTQGAPLDIDVVLVMAESDSTPEKPPVEAPTTPEPTTPEAALPSEVEIAVKAALAAEIGDTETTVESYSRQTWSDGCLGLGGPAEACLAALTEGWQVELVDSATGNRYTYRTNENGSAVRLDENAGSSISN